MWCRCLPLLCFGVLFSGPLSAEPFDFVALGDTAYNAPEEYPAYEALIDTINAAEPAFSIHVGDIFGAALCTDTLYERHQKFFQRFDHPLIYTPGDNEWVDCPFSAPELRNPDTGTFDLNAFVAGKGGAFRQDRLKTLRRMFFPEPQSLGAKPMPLERQGDGAVFPEMVENARWTQDGVLFATVHIPGSMNALNIASEDSSAEAARRNRANLDWIDTTFDEATENKRKALVIVFHADMFEWDRGDTTGAFPISSHKVIGGALGPFYWITGRLAQRASSFDGQVLLIHGDGHHFIIDRPLSIYQGETDMPKRPHVTRLQVFGAPEIKAVRVTVDTDTPWVFSYAPLYN